MAGKTYKKIEQRVNKALPDWKDWPRRLRRVYASLEDWGASEAAVIDMVRQWGWEWTEIQELIKASPSFALALQEYRASGNYPKLNHWVKFITTEELKTVYIREGELTSYASLDENPKATTYHQNVIAQNGMLDFAEPYSNRDGILDEETKKANEPATDSGLTSFQDE